MIKQFPKYYIFFERKNQHVFFVKGLRGNGHINRLPKIKLLFPSYWHERRLPAIIGKYDADADAIPYADCQILSTQWQTCLPYQYYSQFLWPTLHQALRAVIICTLEDLMMANKNAVRVALVAIIMYAMNTIRIRRSSFLFYGN